MNKKQLIANANALISDYNTLIEDQRYYQGQNRHSVDVKRYNNYIDIKELIKDYPVKYREEIKNMYTDEDIEQVYQLFIEQAREQLRYEISDIENITKGCKDEHKTFKHITDDKVLFLGRSGGWACFEDDGDQIANELDGWINEEDIKEFEEDIKNHIEELSQIIEEITYLKDFIDNYNAGLDFESYIKEEINNFIEDLKEEEEDQATNKSRFIQDITATLNTLEARTNQFKEDTTLTGQIDRNIKSIKAIIKKANI